jgi:uncharacterized protein DUF4365
MEVSQSKEMFSIAYVRAVASVIGCNVGRQDVDEDSVDMTLSMTIKTGRIHAPKIDLQLKCTSKSSIKNGGILFRLKEKNFDELRDSECLVPRILVVTLVPDNPSEWIEQDHDRLLMKKCSYWFSLKGMAKPSTSSVSICIPDSQAFTSKALLEMMEKISKGMPL